MPAGLTVIRAVDKNGLPIPGAYSPASADQAHLALRGGDKQTDSLGNVTVGLEVLPFKPTHPTKGALTIPSGTGAGTQTLTLASAANQVLHITGFEISSDLAASGSTALLFVFGSWFGPTAVYGVVSSTQPIFIWRDFPVPIQINGTNTGMTLAVTLGGVTNFNLRLALWGYLADI